MRKLHVPAVALAILALQGCSPTKPPTDLLDAASRSLGSARTAGAAEYAAPEYRSAGRRYDQAQAAEAREDYDEAARLARESSADSELAIAKARLGKAREAVDRLKQENAVLDRDLTDHASPEAGQ
jgi:transposase InsO family protein